MANTLTQTTLSGAITTNQNVFNVASTANISAPVNNFYQQIYVIDPGSLIGELMTVIAVPVSGTIQVSRLDQFKINHVNGAIVIINVPNGGLGLLNGFVDTDPPTVPPQVPPLSWIVNVVNGRQWLYSTVSGTWVPGFNNTEVPNAPMPSVASVAGAITPTGPMFHVTGTNAITGITLPSGFTSGEITIIADAVFSWTAAGNIATASSGLSGGVVIVGRAYRFVYDWNTTKWYTLSA